MEGKALYIMKKIVEAEARSSIGGSQNYSINKVYSVDTHYFSVDANDYLNCFLLNSSFV